MAAFIRGRKTGISSDLSAGITPDLFAPDDQARFGINSLTSCLAYDPVQSLLAVGTSESKFGPGRVYVFGQKRVHRIFDPPRPTSIAALHFSASRLVAITARSEVVVWDLVDGHQRAVNVIAGGVACSAADPLLDWAFLGLRTGEVIAYDLDRDRLAAAFKLPNFWKDRESLGVRIAIVSLALHPRDIGQLLIGYNLGAVIYSIKQNKPTKFLEYVLPPGAPGGDGEISAIVPRPTLTHAVWHPTGTFVLTTHEDGSLVFWDPKEEKVVMARTLADAGVDKTSSTAPKRRKTGRIVNVAWCCKQNPDDTALLVAGGQNEEADGPALTFLELGPTPIYQTSSWQTLEQHFRGKRTMQLPLPAQPSGFLLVPRASPYFAGGQDPIATIVNLSGELLTLSFPSGYPISPTNQLHPFLSFVHPYVTRFAVAAVPREKWLGFTERRNQGGAPLLKGGAPAPRPRRRFEDRTILQLAHGDGTVRLWDSGHEDEIENPAQLQVDVARALDRFDAVNITAMGMSSTTGEFVAGTDRGEVVVYRWGRNQAFGRDPASQPKIEHVSGAFTDISSRTEPALKEGLQPFTLYDMQHGAITAVCVSGIGFVAVGSENGYFSLIDLRGPTVLFSGVVSQMGRDKRASLFKHHHATHAGGERPSTIEFGIMTLDDDKYSSIACFVGTSAGRVLTFKILPSGPGHSAFLAGAVSFDGDVKAICPMVTDSGRPAAATVEAMVGLRSGKQVDGVLVVATEHAIRIFKPSSRKGASKDFSNALCDAAAITEVETGGRALVALLSDRSARAYSLPALKEISRAHLPMLDPARCTQAVVMPTGNIFAWVGPSELAMLDSWGVGRGVRPSDDVLVNPDAGAPPRPTISNVQWLSGTQYISPSDLDLLVGGPDRPPSKRMLAAAAAEKQAARAAAAANANANANASASAEGGGSNEGWGEYLTRQLNERTEKLNIMGDSMDNLSNATQGWADDVNKYVSRQKRGAVMGYVSGRFF